jgi:crotonobetainyl-CoA hydratase
MEQALTDGAHDDTGGSEPALFERVGAVAVITFNRPAVRNAVNAALATRAGALLADADADPDVRAIVLTGAGDAFCAGADLKAVRAGDKPFADGKSEWGFAGITSHFVNKPVIAAVNGVAVGGGTEIALMCDLVVASEQATFGLPEVTRGIVAGAGGLVRLQHQVPLKIAMHAALTGLPLSAAEAQRWGLVNEVVAHNRTLASALALADRIAANAPLAVQLTKRVLLELVNGARASEALGWTLSDQARAIVRDSDDAREGALAFIEKRAPRWTGA